MEIDMRPITVSISYGVLAGIIILLAAALPAGVDWIGDVMGWWTNTPASRMATGGIFGIIAGYFLAKAVGDILRERRLRRETD